MPKSVLDAIKLGLWDFEPPDVDVHRFHSTGAMPGTMDKLDIMAERVRQGLPLWHPMDRKDCDENDDQFGDA